MGFENILMAISLGLSLTSCISTAILWTDMIRKFRALTFFSSERNDDGE
ncbi:MAG TPA: hypothetical protein PK024_12065 [Methanospirillum sp.]|nr:hypothetical protein [Methanospirillum sp.]HOJ97558.1 hypothetical protein [Methanospirillum sp.]